MSPKLSQDEQEVVLEVGFEELMDWGLQQMFHETFPVFPNLSSTVWSNSPPVCSFAPVFTLVFKKYSHRSDDMTTEHSRPCDFKFLLYHWVECCCFFFCCCFIYSLVKLGQWNCMEYHVLRSKSSIFKGKIPKMFRSQLNIVACA